jgi:serine/threonine protein kinase
LISGLHAIHAAGIIHGDLKPQNILLDIANDKLVICDFGVSCLKAGGMQNCNIQTLAYRAPEINVKAKYGVLDPSIDIWSLGCILYELLHPEHKPFYQLSRSVQAFTRADTQDASIYACVALGIPCDPQKRKRFRDLFAVNLGYLVYWLQKSALRKQNVSDSNGPNNITTDVMDICARCLLPNPVNRVNTETLMKLINIQPEPSQRPIIAKVNVDLMQCLINVDLDIISICSETCLCLAENIYLRTVDVANSNYAALYIASAIYSHNSVDILTRSIEHRTLLAAVCNVLEKINFEVIEH